MLMRSHTRGVWRLSSSVRNHHARWVSSAVAAPSDAEAQRLLAASEVIATRHDRGWNFLLSQPVAEAEQPFDLAALRCAVPEAGAAVLFGAQVLAPPSLGLSVAAACAPLLAHALNHLAEVRQWNVVGLAALPGLCVSARCQPPPDFCEAAPLV